MRILAGSATARIAIGTALLAQLQPTVADMFYTITSYFVYSVSTEVYPSTCSDNCRTYTYTDTLTVKPTVTPTAEPVSSRTSSDTYDDVEIVSVFLPPGAVAKSDIQTGYGWDYDTDRFTFYAVPVTMTAPTSCPTSFEVATYYDVYVPYDVRPYMSAESTITSTNYKGDATYYIHLLDPSAVAPTARVDPTTKFEYSYYVKSCRNPTATGADYWGPTTTSSSGGSRGPFSGGDSWDSDWHVCGVYTGCVRLAVWVIVIATIIPALFLFGFVESYFWFRRLMLGKSALRLGTVCWCLISLWVILLTRKSSARSEADQALLREYWKSLSAGTRIKLWFKWGFRWRYPVELLGNPDGTTVVVVQQPPPAAPGTTPGQFPPPPPGGDPSAAAAVVNGNDEKTQDQQQSQIGVVPGSAPITPTYPGQQPPQGYVWMPAPPQGAYVPPGQQPPQPAGYYASPQQPVYAPYPPSSSPAPTSTATPPPPVYGQTPPPQQPGQQ